MSIGWVRRAAAALVVIVVALTSSAARAASPAAEALFQEGRRLMAAGNTAEACARFAESYALEASSGKMLNLALCHETEGKTATAWAEYRAAARLARNEGRVDRAATADEKVAALDPKLSHLTITAAKPVPGLKIASEEGSLSEGGLGVAMPIDPGVHQVKASAPGYRPWTVDLEVKETELRILEIPELAKDSSFAAAPAVQSRLETPSTALRTEPLPGQQSGRRLSVSATILGAVGIAGLMSGALFAVAYESSNGESKAICADKSMICTVDDANTHATLHEDAIRDLTLEIVSFGVGGAAVLTAVYLWRRSVQPVPTTSTAGVRITTRPLAWSSGFGANMEIRW